MNLRLNHVHLQDPDAYRIYDDLDIDLHNKIAKKPDTIYVDPEVAGTKRKVESILPVGPELKTALTVDGERFQAPRYRMYSWLPA